MSLEQSITVFGTTTFRNQERRFGIKKDDRRRHMYLLGQTGTGKSTLQENLILNDIRAGNGVAVVDPHGDMVEKLIDFIPTERINDVIYFNPSDTEYPIAFNILENVNPIYKPLVASGLVGVFKKIWADSWGPRLEYILMNTILALIDFEGSTLLAVTRMLVDKTYRKRVVDELDDPTVRSFWVDEFANYQDKFRSEAIAPIQNKVGQFLSSPIIRNIVGQSKSTIEMRDIMDNKKILLMNLSKGRIGEENSALLGAMMITKLQLAAMSRVDIPEEERKDFYLYVDEFQNFATESFAQILSEARKYHLCLILAHQYVEQLDEKVQASVFGNCGTLVIYRVGAPDAEFLETQFMPNIEQLDLVNIPNFHFYIRLMIDGVTSRPFSAKGLMPISGRMGNAQQVIEHTRYHYGKPKALIEEKIRRWAGMHHEVMTEAAASGHEGELPKFIRKVEEEKPRAPEGRPERAVPSAPALQPAPTPRPVASEQTKGPESTASSSPVGINFIKPKSEAPSLPPLTVDQPPEKKKSPQWEVPQEWVPVSSEPPPMLQSLKEAIGQRTVEFKGRPDGRSQRPHQQGQQGQRQGQSQGQPGRRNDRRRP